MTELLLDPEQRCGSSDGDPRAERQNVADSDSGVVYSGSRRTFHFSVQDLGSNRVTPASALVSFVTR